MSLSPDGRLVVCDDRNCASVFRWPASRIRPDPAQLRKLAAEWRGWSRDERGGDRCPEHAARSTRPRAPPPPGPRPPAERARGVAPGEDPRAGSAGHSAGAVAA